MLTDCKFLYRIKAHKDLTCFCCDGRIIKDEYYCKYRKDIKRVNVCFMCNISSAKRK